MSDDLQKIQMRNTMIVSLVALGGLLLAFLIAVLALRGVTSPGEAIAGAIGAVATTIGTLAGLVAGKAAGESGKTEAEKTAQAAREDAAVARQDVIAARQDADKARAQSRVLAGALPREVYEDVETKHQAFFQS
jgi:hypothetical protein